MKLAVIGGSITEGAAASSQSKRYANLFQSWLSSQFPGSAWQLVNAGVGATGSDYGALRVKKAVLDSHPDLVVVEFAVNDADLNHYGDFYEGLIRQVLADPGQPAIILLFMMDSRGGNRQDWQSVFGAHYNLPMVSYRDAVWPEIQLGHL